MNDEHIDLCPCFECGKDFRLKVGDVLTPRRAFSNAECGSIRIIGLIRCGTGINRVAYRYFVPLIRHCTLEEVLAGENVVSKAHDIQKPDKHCFNSWSEKCVLENYRKL